MSYEQIEYLEVLLSKAFNAETCKVLPVFKGYLAACMIPGKEDEKDLFVFWVHEEKLKGILSNSGIKVKSFKVIKTGVSIAGGILAFGVPGVGIIGGAIAEAGYYLLSKNRRLQVKFGEPPQDNMNFSPKTHFIETSTYYLSKNEKIAKASEYMRRAKTKLEDSTLLKDTRAKLGDSELLKKTRAKLEESELLQDVKTKLSDRSRQLTRSTKDLGSKFSKKLSRGKKEQKIETQEMEELELRASSEDAMVEEVEFEVSSLPEDITDEEFELSSSPQDVIDQEDLLSFTKIRFNSQFNVARLQDMEIEHAMAGDKLSKLKSAVDLVSSTAPTSYTSFDEKRAQEFIIHLKLNGFDVSLLED
ncbi:MAG: hypothetical protein ACFFC7_07935 [Candidatus Hermodarchaeota archaeon]